MTKVLIDTNVFLRYLVEDDLKQAEESKELMFLIEIGKITPYVSNIVIFEIAYTLKTFYKMQTKLIGDWMTKLLKLRNITVLEKTNSQTAIDLFLKTGIKYSDCLIAGQLKKDMVLVSYDKDFDKLIPGKRKEPKDFL